MTLAAALLSLAAGAAADAGAVPERLDIERCRSTPEAGGRGDSPDGAKAGCAGPERTERTLATLRTEAEARAALTPHGRPLVVHFWALWCPACTEELSAQGELARQARAAGADVVFVNLDLPEDSARVLKQLAKAGAVEGARHVQLSEALDPGAVASLVDRHWSAGIPATFALGPGGAVAARVVGPVSAADRENLLRLLRAPKNVQPAANR